MSGGMEPLGRLLVLVGAVLALIGALLLSGLKVSWLGHLPGDISVQRDGMSFYFPLTTCLLLSVLVSALLWGIGRWFRP